MNGADLGEAVIKVVMNGGIGRRRTGLGEHRWLGRFLSWLWHSAFRCDSV